MMQDYNNDVRIGACPCKGCTERHDVCHMSCSKYKKWKLVRETIRFQDHRKEMEDAKMEKYERDKYYKKKKEWRT